MQQLLMEEVGDRHIHIVKLVSPELLRAEMCPDCRNKLDVIWDDNDKMTRQCTCCSFEEIEV